MSETLVPFVDVLAEHALDGVEIEAAINSAVRSGAWILGDDVARFEQEFADYCGTRHAIGTDSGMSALVLALLALDVGPGDEVIVQANTFVATVFAIMHAGATPVLIDAEPETFQLDPEQLAGALTSKTKAVVPVHLYGHPAPMDEVLRFANNAGIAVVEDACQAHGARLRGSRVGTFGDAAAFSFYPSKNLGAYGDGGMIVTDNASLADELRVLRNYGQRGKYNHVRVGFNNRLDTLQAAALRVKLRSLDGRNAARRRHAAAYGELLGSSGVTAPAGRADVEHVWHLYVIQTKRRDDLKEHLGARGIESGIHYPVPVHRQPACRGLGYREGCFPVAENCARKILSLPMHPQLDQATLEYVAEAVDDFHGARRSTPVRPGLPAPAS